MQRQTQRHNMGVMLTEFEGRSVLRKGAYIHTEKIYRELTVDIVKLIFIFPVVLISVKDEMLPFFFRRESLATVRAAQGELLAEAVFTR